jgi:4-amino-4-deoxy-L-arabinose transferase-like glycosyltransferase
VSPVDVLLGCVLAAVIVATWAAWLADRHGRSFWVWFVFTAVCASWTGWRDARPRRGAGRGRAGTTDSRAGSEDLVPAIA